MPLALADDHDHGRVDDGDRPASFSESRRHLPVARPAPRAGRPRIRDDCRSLARPCKFHKCEWNSATWTTSYFQGVPGNCVLDVVERGGVSLDEIATAVGASREFIRRLEADALRKLRRLARSVYFDF